MFVKRVEKMSFDELIRKWETDAKPALEKVQETAKKIFEDAKKVADDLRQGRFVQPIYYLQTPDRLRDARRIYIDAAKDILKESENELANEAYRMFKETGYPFHKEFNWIRTRDWAGQVKPT